MRGEEWKLFRFSPEEEKDALRHQGILEVPPVRSHTSPITHTSPSRKETPRQGKRDGGGGGGVSVSERKEERVSERKEEKATRFLDIRAPASVRQAPVR